MLLGLACTLVLVACRKSNTTTGSAGCGPAVVQDSTRYYDVFTLMQPQPMSLDTIYILGDCLHISIASGGCDGSTWELSAWDRGHEQNGQRQLSFWLENTELCLAFIHKDYVFDLTDLQVPGLHTLTLNFMQFQPVRSLKYHY